MTYLAAITAVLVASYFGVSILFSWFFAQQLPTFNVAKALRSMAIIFATVVAILIVVIIVPDPAISNRIQHAFAGGFAAFLVCYLVMRDLKLPMSKFQFAVFSALTVTALGVGNELAEFMFQEYIPIFPFQFSETPIDTWLDLVSNSVGTVLGALCFVPLIQEGKSTNHRQ